MGLLYKERREERRNQERCGVGKHHFVGDVGQFALV